MYSALKAYIITQYNRYCPLHINDINLIPSIFCVLQNIYWLFYSVCVYDDAKCYISKLLIAFYRTPLHCWLLFSSTWMTSPASRSRRNHSITVTTCVYTVHVSAIGASFYSIFAHVPFPEVLNHLQYKDGCSVEPRHEELASHANLFSTKNMHYSSSQTRTIRRV